MTPQPTQAADTSCDAHWSTAAASFWSRTCSGLGDVRDRLGWACGGWLRSPTRGTFGTYQPVGGLRIVSSARDVAQANDVGGAQMGSDQGRRGRRGQVHMGGLTCVVLGATLLTGCSGGTPEAPVTVTAVVTESATPVPAVTVTATATETATAPPTKTTDKPTEKAAESSSKIKVPDGVGMSYQDAQDLWRSSGLSVMPATDATGANRIPILDSGWVVLDQDPKAGSKVEDGSTITATIKKYTDD